jgi:hypothetical protein
MTHEVGDVVIYVGANNANDKYFKIGRRYNIAAVDGRILWLTPGGYSCMSRAVLNFKIYRKMLDACIK